MRVRRYGITAVLLSDHTGTVGCRSSIPPHVLAPGRTPHGGDGVAPRGSVLVFLPGGHWGPAAVMRADAR